MNFDFKVTVTGDKPDWSVLNREAKKLADDVSLHVQSQVKIALVRAKAIATGKTLKSVATERILDSPSRGIFIRNIIARSVWQFIQNGRRAGARMPPEEPMREWFAAFNIPRKAWFPIRLSIARRGIKPRRIKEKALQMSRPYIAGRSADAGRTIAANLMKRNRP